MADQTLSGSLDAARDIMSRLTIFPLGLEANTAGVQILAAMPEDALRTRSRGPYSADNLPPEATRSVEAIGIQLSRWEQREFTVEIDGPWPRLVMTMPDKRLLVRFVVPEDAPPVYQPDPGNATLSLHISHALEFSADSLRLAGRYLGNEPPVALTLGYPDDPDYEAKVAKVADDFRSRVPPVIPTIEVNRRRCRKKQRIAHDEALRSVAESYQTVEELGRNGFTTQLGLVRIQDSGG